MKKSVLQRNMGVTFDKYGTAHVRVWSPDNSNMQLELSGKDKKIDLQPAGKGFWNAQTGKIFPGDAYRFVINNKDKLPDPASVSQPDGVHGDSVAADFSVFQWQENEWKNHALQDYIIYELHTGTFSAGGTFQGIIEKLPYLTELGITAIEIMPVSQFPGTRNWGYDGVYPFAVQHSYGGYRGMQQLVNACHQHKIAVILDVVYNHLGPEGNYLRKFGPYFTHKYNTPWGQAINYDDAWCDGVREYFIENALMWFRDFHVDALRLDAVHAIKDFSAKHILAEMSEYVSDLSRQTGRIYYFIAESDLNDPKYIRSRDQYGYGINAQWIDEFHHALRSTTGEQLSGYYTDFHGTGHLAKAYRDAFVYDGIYSDHRKKTFGAKATDQPGEKFIVFSQNHDQVGNRMLGERTSQLLSLEMQKLLAGAVLLSPYLPLLFMGEEWSAPSPFIYFVSHTDSALIKAVRKGRKEEFKEFHEKGEAPDPQSEATFKLSGLPWDSLNDDPHSRMLKYYKFLISLRKKYRKIIKKGHANFSVWHEPKDKTICLHYKGEQDQLISCMNFSNLSQQVRLPADEYLWQKTFDSSGFPPLAEEPAGTTKGGNSVSIPAESFIVYTKAHV